MLSDGDKQIIYKLAEDLVGYTTSNHTRHDVIVRNVERRMLELKIATVTDYVKIAEKDNEEFARLLSMLTIHTTSWFREKPHFTRLEQYVELTKRGIPKQLRVWCAACSTGEEPYSIALVLEQYRKKWNDFDYQITATDIDPVSLQMAQKAIYKVAGLERIPKELRSEILLGSGKTAGLFTLSKEIRSRCTFKIHDINTSLSDNEKFDVIICRNVLIYFSEAQIKKTIIMFKEAMRENGILMLGHTEAIDSSEYGLIYQGDSTYSVGSTRVTRAGLTSSKRVLVIDDSSVARKLLEDRIHSFGYDCFCVGSAEEADVFLANNNVDLITLDLQMPKVDGMKWLREARRAGLRVPVVIVSHARSSEAHKVLSSLETGAQDFIEKSKFRDEEDYVKDVFKYLIRKGEKSKGRGYFRPMRMEIPFEKIDLILLGASTGGPQALNSLLKDFPANSPPVIVVQHISANFARSFATRLQQTSGLAMGECTDGAKLKRGHIYLSLGDYHIGVKKEGGSFAIRTSEHGLLNSHRPSVDFLFRSAVGMRLNVIAVILTGMGADGAKGIAELKNDGAFTVAQSERDSAVFGMPNEAIKSGGVTFVGSVLEIKELLVSTLNQLNGESSEETAARKSG